MNSPDYDLLSGHMDSIESTPLHRFGLGSWQGKVHLMSGSNDSDIVVSPTAPPGHV